MAITAKMVKELREKTGAGMMDCKKALMKLMEILKKQLISYVKKEFHQLLKKQTALLQKVQLILKLKEMSCPFRSKC